ncbi:hypothetical protein AMJ47_03455 [Parcubacteria bacterium DG_72]|nr:MAG: hypothetical protein AMJ47_03455 [Parcubacteria bacterium DG_72]
MAEYTKEQLWELYEQLPEDLQKAVFSEDIGNKVQGICYDNNITDDKVFIEILKNVGYVFLGLLSPSDFSKVLEEELKLDNAKEVYARINNEVFAELRESLEALYETKIKFEKMEKPASAKATAEETKIKKQDKYLEPLD